MGWRGSSSIGTVLQRGFAGGASAEDGRSSILLSARKSRVVT
jgi:hypothetical protein